MGKKSSSSKEETRGIEDTLDALEIDQDATPDDVAAEAGREVAETVVADTESEQSDDDAGEEGETEDDDDADDGVIAIPPPAPAPIPEPTIPETPVLVPPPKPPTPRKRQNASGAAKLGKGLADKVPGAEKVKVYKREKDGKKWFVSEYTKADIANHTDFESFLTEFVKDEHGAGEYILVGVDGMGREMELGVVRLREPNKGSTQDGALSVVQQILAENQKRDAEYLKRMEETMRPQPQQDPLHLLAGVMNLKKEMEGETAAAGSAAAGSMDAMMKMFASSGDKTMQMMMMMMQQQQAASDRQNQMMMQVLAKPKEEDPITKLLLMKLVEDKDSGSGALPPPPPPPPPGDPLDGITKLLGVLLPVFAGGGGEGEDDFKEFLKNQLTAQAQNALSTKDVLELLNGAKDESKGGDKLKEAADNMALVMNIANNMNRQQEGGPAAGLFDALAALFSNRDFAGSIAQTIRAKTGGGASPGVPPQLAHLPPEQQRAVMQRAALMQQQRAQLAAAQAGTPAAALPPGYVMTPAGPMPAPPPAGTPTAVQPQVPNAAAQRAAELEIARTRKLPELPANTYEHINNLASAGDEGALVGATVTMLIYFAEFEDWRQFSETVLGLARDGNKQGTLEYLTAFFDGLAEIHMIDPTLSKKILAAIAAHFGVLKSQLSDIGLASDELLTGEDLIAGGGRDGDPDGDDGEDDEGDDEEGDVGEGVDPEEPMGAPEPSA